MGWTLVWVLGVLCVLCAADFRRLPALDAPSTPSTSTAATSSRPVWVMRAGKLPRGPWKDLFQPDTSSATVQTATPAQTAPADVTGRQLRKRAARPVSPADTSAPRSTQHAPPASHVPATTQDATAQAPTKAPTGKTSSSSSSSTSSTSSSSSSSSSSSPSSKTSFTKPAESTSKPSAVGSGVGSTNKTVTVTNKPAASTDKPTDKPASSKPVVETSSSSVPTLSSSSSSSTSSSSSSPSSSRPSATLKPDTVTPAGAIELVFVASIFRGGARTPFVPLPNTERDWQISEEFEGFGRLTYIGERQMLDLGRSLYLTYRDMFPGKDEFSPSLVTARATDAPWSIASARALLAGMFPTAWVVPNQVPQVFPVHVNLEKDDLLLLAPRNCPLYRFEMQEQLHRISNPQWARVLAKSEALRTHFRRMYKDQMDASAFTLENWDVFYDPLECYRANGEGKPHNLTEKQIDDALDIGQELERVNYPSSHGGMLGGNLMSHVLGLMRQVIASRNKTASEPWEKRPRFHLFSGHRETISSLLAMLGQPIDVIPKFADHMEIQLLRTVATNAHAVRIVYNTNNALKVCANGTLEACEFSRFEDEMSVKLAQDWGLSCQREEKMSCIKKNADQGASGSGSGKVVSVVSPINGLWYVVSLAAVLLVIAVSVLVFWKWKRRAQEGDEPEEIPMRPITRRGPKKFTLE